MRMPLVNLLRHTLVFNNHTRRLANAALVCIGFFLILVLLLHFLETEFDPVSRFISEYVLGDYGYLMNTAFFVLGIGIGLLAIGMSLDLNPGHKIASRLLGVSAVSIILAGIFNADPSTSDGPTTTTGTIHLAAVGSTTLTGLVAAFVLASRFKQDSRWRQSARLAFWWAVVMFVTASIQAATTGTDVAGLLQRISVIVVIGWVLYVANLLRLVAN